MAASQSRGLAEQLSAARGRFAERGWIGAHARFWYGGLDGAAGTPAPVASCFAQGRDAVALLQPPHVQALGFCGVTVARCLLPKPPATIWASSMRPAERSPAEALEVALSAALAGHDAVVLDRFGLLVAASSWGEVEQRVAAIEHAAQVTHLGRQSPGAPAEEERVARFAAGLAVLGIEADGRCQRCNACPLGGLVIAGKDALAEMLLGAIDAHLSM